MEPVCMATSSAGEASPTSPGGGEFLLSQKTGQLGNGHVKHPPDSNRPHLAGMHRLIKRFPSNANDFCSGPYWVRRLDPEPQSPCHLMYVPRRHGSRVVYHVHMGNRSSPDKLLDTNGWALTVRLLPQTARPPLAVAWKPEDVPLYDWSLGISPWAPLVGFVEPVPLPELTYPRLVRGASFSSPQPPPSLPLYKHMSRLADKAERHPPDSPAFAQAVLETASQIGLLDPYGPMDSLAVWHFLALEIRTYIRFFWNYQKGPKEWQEIIFDLRSRWGWEVSQGGGWTYRGPEAKRLPALAVHTALDAVEEAFKRAQSPASGLKELGAIFIEHSWPEILARADWRDAVRRGAMGQQGPVFSRVGSRVWILLELGLLFARAEEVRFCANPRCGLPFLPKRKDQETCGREACVKQRQRERRRQGLGPRRPGWKRSR